MGEDGANARRQKAAHLIGAITQMLPHRTACLMTFFENRCAPARVARGEPVATRLQKEKSDVITCLHLFVLVGGVTHRVAREPT